MLRMVPQPKETESSKVEAKAKALTAKKALENIHSFKEVCTFSTGDSTYWLQKQPRKPCKSTPQQNKLELNIMMRFPLTAE